MAGQGSCLDPRICCATVVQGSLRSPKDRCGEESGLGARGGNELGRGRDRIRCGRRIGVGVK